MTAILLRVLVAALIALFLALRISGAQGRRRLAFSLGAGGWALVALANLLAWLFGNLVLVGVVSVAATLALGGALVALAFAYRDGEFSAQFNRARAALDEEARSRSPRG